jgi:hypothetical protein
MINNMTDPSESQNEDLSLNECLRASVILYYRIFR